MTRLTAMLAAVVVAALVVAPETLRATAQVPDRIAIDGKEYPLVVNPLEGYFADHPDRRPSSPAQTSSNWRGYIAHFAIAAGELVVTDVRVLTEGPPTGTRSAMAEVFPGTARPVAAWFTGHLVVPDGEVVRYVHMGYGSEYARYILVRVKAGVADVPRRVSREVFAEFRQSQFEAYKKTAEYRAALKDLSRSAAAGSPAEIDRFLFDFATADYLTRVFE